MNLKEGLLPPDSNAVDPEAALKKPHRISDSNFRTDNDPDWILRNLIKAFNNPTIIWLEPNQRELKETGLPDPVLAGISIRIASVIRAAGYYFVAAVDPRNASPVGPFENKDQAHQASKRFALSMQQRLVRPPLLSAAEEITSTETNRPAEFEERLTTVITDFFSKLAPRGDLQQAVQKAKDGLAAATKYAKDLERAGQGAPRKERLNTIAKQARSLAEKLDSIEPLTAMEAIGHGRQGVAVTPTEQTMHDRGAPYSSMPGRLRAHSRLCSDLEALAVGYAVVAKRPVSLARRRYARPDPLVFAVGHLAESWKIATGIEPSNGKNRGSALAYCEAVIPLAFDTDASHSITKALEATLKERSKKPIITQ